jgi:predicted phosphohydrolase
MRIVCCSDIHTLQYKMLHQIPEGDVFIFGGDSTFRGREKETTDFIYWLMKLKGFNTKIFIAGNHDFGFELQPDWLLHLINDENLSQSDCVYLEDEEFIIEDPEFSKPIKFYGSPWQPRFFDWAFNVDRDKIHVYWEKIPKDTDVLITHGPPFNIGDNVTHGGITEHVGCNSLLEHINQIRPVLHVFGHLHDGYGVDIVNGVYHVNASICNESYSPINRPIVIDLKEIDGKIVAEWIND